MKMLLNQISSKDLLLRNATSEDAKIITKWKKDPYIQKMALSENVRVSLKKEREDIIKAKKSKYEIYMMVILKVSEKPIGYIRLNFIDKRRKIGWLRFVLGEERGRGYGKEALKVFINYLFNHLNMHRIEAEVYEYNIPSQKLLEGVGFRKEGVKRKAHYMSGKYFNVFIYGLIK